MGGEHLGILKAQGVKMWKPLVIKYGYFLESPNQCHELQFHHDWSLTQYWILDQSESCQLFLTTSSQKYQAFWLQHVLAGNEVT